MTGRSPREIWEEGIIEGERRLGRRTIGLVGTGFAGGADILFGIVAVVVTTGALQTVMPEQPAHVLASLTFGLSFAFITIGRAELFTENFLIPVTAVVAGHNSIRALVRMWAITLVVNIVGLAVLGAIFSAKGVLRPEALDAAGVLADTYGQRAAWPAFLSAIGAGTVMMLFTWVTAAAEGSAARIAASLIVGFILAAPSLNHAVVSVGEIGFGIFAGTAQSDWGDLTSNLAIAIAGNLIGGIGLVFVTRLAQVMGEFTGGALREEREAIAEAGVLDDAATRRAAHSARQEGSRLRS